MRFDQRAFDPSRLVGGRPCELFSRLDDAFADNLDFVPQAFRRELKVGSTFVGEAQVMAPHQII
jgi:hypothetical protein